MLYQATLKVSDNPVTLLNMEGGGGGAGHYAPLLVFLKERSLITAEEGLEDQGWISDMEIDGPTFVPKSGYFLLIWVKVCPQKLAFSYFFSQFYELAF